MTLSLDQKYKKDIVKQLMKEFGYKNVFEVPQVLKVLVSRGVSEAVTNPKAMEVSSKELALICGQRPIVRYAKKAIAAFKLKVRDPIGCFATLRGKKMYLFLNKLINISLPRVRDFRGLNPRSFDGRGNFSFGLNEQLIFPEVDYDKVDALRGMNITIVTSAKTDKEARRLLDLLGIPFRN